MVGIIERGRLLAVGTVEEIQQPGGQTPQNKVEVRLLDDAAALGDWLAAAAEREPRFDFDGDSARFLHAGDPEAEADLLRAMIEAGFRVVAFGTRRQTLEDVFMQVTKGLVQ